MLSPDEFKQQYPVDDLTEELPDAAVSSVRDIQHLYGKLYTLGTTGGGRYAPYLTPDAASDLVDESDSLIVVRVDLSAPEPQLADDERGPVWVTTYRKDRIKKVAHCKYPAARGIDHSVTHQSGQNSDPEKLARYAKERLSRWSTDGVVQSVADDHREGWIVDALSELGTEDDVLNTVEHETIAALDEPTTALLTVQVRLAENEPYVWPGDPSVDVFLAAMRRRMLSKLVSKNQATASAGDATGLVTNQTARTVGTAEDPLNYFLGKQLETFPGLDPDEAWRSHPISEDTAVTLMNSEPFVDACSYRTFGARIYFLPYVFGAPTADSAYQLYHLLYAAVNANDDESTTPIEFAYSRRTDESFDENCLRFYVAAVMPHQMSRYDVFGETMNAQIRYPASLASAHADLLDTAAFNDGNEVSAALPTHKNWLLVSNPDRDVLLSAVASGRYFYETLPEDDNTDASVGDPRIRALVAVLSGDDIPVSSLLEAYVEKIGAMTDDENGFPSFQVAGQYAQLCALAGADPNFLNAESRQHKIIEPPTYETRGMTDDTDTIADGGNPREEKLESFIEATPALNDDERRASFLLGALVGAVGNHQAFRLDRSTTLVDQFPVKSVSRNRIKKVTKDAIGTALTYTRGDKKRSGTSYSGTKFAYITDRLRDSILQTDPSEWEIETADLRFYYALGVTYGMNDDSSSSTNDADTASATPN